MEWGKKVGFLACRCITFCSVLGCRFCLEFMDVSLFVGSIQTGQWNSVGNAVLLDPLGTCCPKISRSQVDTESGRTRAVPGLPPGFQGNWTRVPFNDTASASFNLKAHVHRHFSYIFSVERTSHTTLDRAIWMGRLRSRSDVAS